MYFKVFDWVIMECMIHYVICHCIMGFSLFPKTSVGYLGGKIDQNVSGEAIANKVISKVN